MNRSVLLLNASEEVINVIKWQKAVLLYLSGKAKKPHGFDDYHEVKTGTGVFQLPTALVLVTYVRIPFKRMAVNKVNVLRRDGYECAYCGAKLTNSTGTVDHVVPTSRGGKHKWSNVVASCQRCNNKKADRTPQESGIKLRWKPHTPSKDVVILTMISTTTNESWTRWIMV